MLDKIYLEITNVCNKSCSFCHGTKRESRAMSLGEFARIVGNLNGVTEYLNLHVLGEPLTHPMLPTFIEYATKNRFKVAITTNGTLLPRLGEALIKCGREDLIGYTKDCLVRPEATHARQKNTPSHNTNKNFKENKQHFREIFFPFAK